MAASLDVGRGFADLIINEAASILFSVVQDPDVKPEVALKLAKVGQDALNLALDIAKACHKGSPGYELQDVSQVAAPTYKQAAHDLKIIRALHGEGTA